MWGKSIATFTHTGRNIIKVTTKTVHNHKTNELMLKRVSPKRFHTEYPGRCRHRWTENNQLRISWQAQQPRNWKLLDLCNKKISVQEQVGMEGRGRR